MTVKLTSRKDESDGIFGRAHKAAKMVRAGLLLTFPPRFGKVGPPHSQKDLVSQQGEWIGYFSRSFQMKSVFLVLCIGVLSLCRPTFGQNSSPGPKAIPAKSDGQISFDALKSLAGTWTGRVTTNPPNPEIDGPIQVTMRVASRGNVLVHEITPGGVPEPTMIYLEDDRLTLVHYCEAGNRPRMVAHKSPDPKVMKFDFVDISGSTMPVYLHDFGFTMMDANHHSEDWTFKLPGDQVLHAHFEMKRDD